MISIKKTAALCAASFIVVIFYLCDARAATCSDLTIECLHPEFLKTEIPAYWTYVSSTSPASYSEADNDYLKQFTSPSGKQITVVVKSPVIKKEVVLEAPEAAPNLNVENNVYSGQGVYDYFYYIAQDTGGNLRNQTYIKIPKGTYNFPSVYTSTSNDPETNKNVSVTQNICDFAGGANWPLPAGLKDVVIDGQGSTVNFLGLCSGVNLLYGTRVVLKNFTFTWSGIQIASLGTVTDTNEDSPTYGGPIKVKIDPIKFGPSPKMIATLSRWDSANNHFDLTQWNDASYYGNGMTTGVPFQCAETPEQQKTQGCTLTLYDQQDGFKNGEKVVIIYYNTGTAINIIGQDITMDNITLENILGTGFGLQGGRGLRVTNSTLTRMDGAPVSTSGNASAEFGSVSGDVVFDNNSFGYQGDDAFQVNWNIAQYEPYAVQPLSNPNQQPPAMPFYAFQPTVPNQFLWPYVAVVGDVFVIYDNSLNFEGVRTVTAVSSPNSNNLSTITLDHAIDEDMIKNGFIGGDLTQFAGARYVVNNNRFQFNRARALVLQAPFGLVTNNYFVGQTLRSVYVSTSLFWGEGGSAQELTIANNIFDARGHEDDFLALNIDAEPLDPGLNTGPEVIGSQNNVAAPVNENIIVANNTFLSDHITDVVNIASAHNIIFSGNDFILSGSSASGQYPVSIHDASDIYFDNKNDFSLSWLNNASCTNSRLLKLAKPSPQVVNFSPFACGVPAITSDISLGNPDVCTTNFSWNRLPPICFSGIP